MYTHVCVQDYRFGAVISRSSRCMYVCVCKRKNEIKKQHKYKSDETENTTVRPLHTRITSYLKLVQMVRGARAITRRVEKRFLIFYGTRWPHRVRTSPRHLSFDLPPSSSTSRARYNYRSLCARASVPHSSSHPWRVSFGLLTCTDRKHRF